MSDFDGDSRSRWSRKSKTYQQCACKTRYGRGLTDSLQDSIVEIDLAFQISSHGCKLHLLGELDYDTVFVVLSPFAGSLTLLSIKVDDERVVRLLRNGPEKVS